MPRRREGALWEWEAPLPVVGGGLSVLSYNCLLPNSCDGWWVYKYESALIAEQVRAADADIVCFQETAPESFESDFEFMRGLGYGPGVIAKRGRFRPATFVRPRRWAEARLSSSQVEEAPRRRGRAAVCDAVKEVQKEASKRVDAAPAVVVLGDFNADGRTGVRELLLQGAVGPEFGPDPHGGDPVAPKRKELAIAPLRHGTVSSTYAYAVAYDPRPPPSTMYLAELIPLMHEGGQQRGEGSGISALLDGLLRKVHGSFASTPGGMSLSDCGRWLLTVNGRVGRGSEYRA
eukprot:gene8160-57667_t